jgi:Secretion system C-terminal sorting domain/Glycosyl hydrolase family 79 C-terminal beta domain
MKFILKVIFICCAYIVAILAQSSVVINVNTQKPGDAIPATFSGLSFGTKSLERGSKGYFFDSSDLQVLILFREMGIRELRIGGTSVDTNNSGYIPSFQDIDALFRFAKAANVKVIYSLKLLNGNPVQDAITAKYIWDNYSQYLDCFAIGNEPNIYKNMDPQITSFSTYLSKWTKFANTIVDSVPNAKFGGPDGGSGSGGASWGTSFASNEYYSHDVSAIFFHNYVGNSSAGKTVQQLIDEMLSPSWPASEYPAQYNDSGKPVLSIGFPYRFTESNSYYTGGGAGVSGGNNCFATALFSLDYMHWWTLYKCLGVCFHTAMWKYNGTFYIDSYNNYQIYPIGYGIKAFDLGGHGSIKSDSISNPDGLNLTAYAVDDTTFYYITIINKEHDSGARDANVKIVAGGLSDSAAVVYLQAPNGNLAATSGITLGGAPINNSGTWQGVWSPIDSVNSNDSSYMLTVPAGSAAIVKIKTNVTSISKEVYPPEKFSLYQNYPNPFNPSTTIKYQIPKVALVNLRVFNILGQEVANLVNTKQAAGNYVVNFNAKDLTSGIYFYRLKIDGFSRAKKMLLMK